MTTPHDRPGLRIAEFVCSTDWKAVSDDAVTSAKRAILDTLGVALAGSVEPPAEIVRRVAEVEGGTPLCTVIGTRLRTGAVWAALANGVAAHALDFDDTNFTMMGHPSVPVLMAALAAGEAGGATGRDLLLAYLVGFDVEVALGQAVNPSHYERGWHATGTLGTFGAAAAAAKIFGLDTSCTLAALGLAASQASGLKENFGTMTKPFHAGHAARGGVLAALLAREGFTASPSALDGLQGFLALGGDAADGALGALGAPWRILSSGVAVKPYPCCALTHSTIDALVDLRREHGLGVADIEAVEVAVGPVVPTVLLYPSPATGLEAKFSMEYCSAAALARGAVGLDAFETAAVHDPEIRRLMTRVRMRVAADGTRAGTGSAHSSVRVSLRDGRVLTRPATGARGHPDAPLSDAALREKFEECAARVLEPARVSVLAEVLATLEGCPDVRTLTTLLQP
jgi:2-methylcitrate dehydratase PrpD